MKTTITLIGGEYKTQLQHEYDTLKEAEEAIETANQEYKNQYETEDDYYNDPNSESWVLDSEID